ncbi:Uncharacterised protein [Mycobacteroides abscessus subsp. massiliense]|nr:Uncharacterised protein [Mycobacteroides abscessus subsp. massiliense]
MLRGQHHVGGAEERVGPGGEHLDVPHARRAEQHRRTLRAADPVALHGFDFVRPVQHVQVIDQPVGICGNPHHPLPQALTEHREVAALAAPVRGDLFVGQHGAQSRTPVDHRIRLVHQAIRVDNIRPRTHTQLLPHGAVGGCARSGVELGDQLLDGPGTAGLLVVPGVVDLQEDPLRPLIEVDIGSGEAAPRVVPARADPAAACS